MTLLTMVKQKMLNKSPHIQFKSRSVTLPTIYLYSNNADLLALSFKEQLNQVALMKQASVILDLSHVDQTLDIDRVLDITRDHQIHVISVQGGSSELNTRFKQRGINALQQSKLENNTNKLKETCIHKTIRSGQQIYSEAPLIIFGDVSAAAEVMSDASIHIYGELRGRAMAGIRGDRNTHVFALSSHAEMVSIADVQQVSGIGQALSFNQPSRFSIMDNNIMIFNL